jgi:hypothetical protein
MAETWTSIGRAAELLSCERELIYRWMNSGELRSRGGTEVCLMVEAAGSLDEMAVLATNDSGREAALGVMLAKMAQDDARRSERAARRKGIFANALAALLLMSVAAGSYEVARLRAACVMGGEMLLNAQSENKKLIVERDAIRESASHAMADAAELRGKLAAMEQMREADARLRKAGTVIDTIVAMWQ